MATEAVTSASETVEWPMDLVRLSIDERVLVKCRGGRELRAKLIVRPSLAHDSLPEP